MGWEVKGEEVGGGSLGCWMGGWVNARGRRREGLREPGEAEVTGVGVVGDGAGTGDGGGRRVGGESFFHTQLS